MAIIESVIMGRATGSIGNVTLSTQKGRVIAKQKASIVANPNTQAQQEQRTKLKTLVKAWQQIGNYVKSGITAIPQYSSEYNTYVSKNIDIFQPMPAGATVLQGIAYLNSYASIGTLGTIIGASVSKQAKVFNLTWGNSNLKNLINVGDKIHLFLIAKNSFTPHKTEVVFTTEMLNATNKVIPFNIPSITDDNNYVYAYWVESADGKKSSSAKFASL